MQGVGLVDANIGFKLEEALVARWQVEDLHKLHWSGCC